MQCVCEEGKASHLQMTTVRFQEGIRILHGLLTSMVFRKHLNEELESFSWAEAPIKIARMTLTIKLDRNWSSFQLANSAPPLSVTGSAIALSARVQKHQDDN